MIIQEMSLLELTRTTNKEFKIKVNGVNYIGPSISKLVGFEGLVEIIGSSKLAEKLCRKALASPDDKYVARLRRGLKITFYTK